MSTPSTDMWSQWWKLQGRMLDAWKEAVKTADKKEETTTAANDLWQTWIRTQEQMLELWKTTVLPAAGQKSPVYPGPVMDVWQEWGRNQDKMLSLWKQALTMSPPDKVMQSFAGPFKDLWREWWNVQEKILALCKQAATAEPGGLTDLFGIRSARMWPEMLRNQEKMLGFWNEFMGLSQPGKAMDMHAVQEFSDRFAEFYRDWMKTLGETLSQYVKWVPDSEARRTFEKTLQSTTTYTRLFNFWTTLTGKLAKAETLDGWQAVMREEMQEYNQVLAGFFAAILPEQMHGLLLSPVETASAYQQHLMTTLQPFLEAAPEMHAKLAAALTGDRKAYADFLRLWNQSTQEMYDKYLHLPALGMGREKVADVLSCLDAYVDYVAESNELLANMYATGYDAMEKLVAKYAELGADGRGPVTFRELYELWWQTNEQAYVDLFKTESFARLLAATMDAQVRFKMKAEELLGSFLESMSIPARKEMDSLYRSVYQVKKAVKEQARAIEELRSLLNGQKGGAAQQ